MLPRLLALGLFVLQVSAMGSHSDACFPTPCGPNTDCQVNGNGVAICRCKPGFFPKPDTITGCGPQCTGDSECSGNTVCSGGKCINPCDGACGIDALCEVRIGRAICRCPSGTTGDPFTRCTRTAQSTDGRILNSGSSFTRDTGAGVSSSTFHSNVVRQSSTTNLCSNFGCGSNADCQTLFSRPVCKCRVGYEGDPYTGCRRSECVENAECPSNKVCHNFQCINPCSTSCGVDAECDVRNHVTVCRCPTGFTGDPFTSCVLASSQALVGRQSQDFCNPTPCGINSKCRMENGRAVCSCQDGYFGNPIDGCKHECESDNECSLDRSCVNFRCDDPCKGCGQYADCRVQNHRAVCTCPENFLGNPYSRCYPECTQHEECNRNQACFNLKCVDPCAGACGENADCRVENHKAICSCPKGYTGHPFTRCRPFDLSDLCNPNPCGDNADCKPGKDRQENDRPVCFCKTGFIGDPLVSCRRGECLDHNDCRGNEACYGHVCVNPCSSTSSSGRSSSVCGVNAQCMARNHGAVCHCPVGYDGDPLTQCNPSRSLLHRN